MDKFQKNSLDYSDVTHLSPGIVGKKNWLGELVICIQLTLKAVNRNLMAFVFCCGLIGWRLVTRPHDCFPWFDCALA